ncbi:VPLPA-CTERM sorting domain-containing protein [Seohaeicola zhoushanensis]|uniref:VPLPA-CTERM protein sorting domain-containing protein n=1 Tax=Seohaeicola zhoushanensis TaxID=1569283 RepID=A0A8J3M8Q6_9RHOB|nr:VPLPA-CTERM sorting domain-containing protein [Seohaeicola zhoushanensis]GHF60953.1 hypothetical protein GCM10017056_35450 [Seohaeicola zhoushanensis]
MQFAKCIAAGAFALAALGSAVSAAPVNGTGDVISDVIFGSGNGNGGFTGETQNNIEVALRGKQRYPKADVFNYDGDHTYTFDSTVLTTNPTNRSVFNFEWSVNVDASGTSGAKLSDFDYALMFDVDPSAGTSFASTDPFDTDGYYDHSLGDNSTGNGNGIESASIPALQSNMALYSVAQQSSNLGFGFSLDPDLPGSYDFAFLVYEKGTENVLASAAITVNVLPVEPVPLPAGLPLMMGAVGAFAYLKRRKARR